MWTTSGNGHGVIGGENRLRKGSKGRSGRNAPIVNHLSNDDFSNFELLHPLLTFKENLNIL